MNANGNLGGAEVCSSHLIGISLNNKGKYLPLTRREKALMALQFGEFCSLLPRDSINSNRVVDRAHQFLVAAWLREELDRARLHGAHRRRDIPMAGDENKRWRMSSHQLLLKFEAACSRQLQIQNQACRGVGLILFQELGGRTEDSDLKSHRGNELRSDSLTLKSSSTTKTMGCQGSWWALFATRASGQESGRARGLM